MIFPFKMVTKMHVIFSGGHHAYHVSSMSLFYECVIYFHRHMECHGRLCGKENENCYQKI